MYKNLIKKLFVLPVVFAVMMAFVSCGSGDGQDEALIGTWEFVYFNADYRYVFNEDGTGDRGIPGYDIQTFTWSTNNEMLNISIDDTENAELASERWQYSVVGNALIIASQHNADLVIMLEARTDGQFDAELLGTWQWEFLDDWVYIFNEDGTGRRGIFGEYIEAFTWSTDSDRLNITRDEAEFNELFNERWLYTIINNVLTMESRQEAELVMQYTRQ